MDKIIIVADDSEIIKNIVEKALKDEFNVLKANSGKEAIECITNYQSSKILGLLLDLNMPEYDGFMVLDYLKENDLLNKIPVSIITGDDSKETINRAFTYNIVDMLNKPFSINDVKNIIEKMISHKH